MKELVIGEMALFGTDKKKRIYLGTFGTMHLAVKARQEKAFKDDSYFDAITWDKVEPLQDEPEFEERWKMLQDYKEYTICTDLYYNQERIDKDYKEVSSWYKGDSIKVQINKG